MKKFFAALLAAMMVLSLVSIPKATSRVQAEGEVVFTAATVEDVEPGATVDVPVTLIGQNFEAHTLNMYVEYDPEKLTLNSATIGAACSDATLPLLDTAEEGKVKLGLLYVSTGMTAGGELFTMNFTVAEDVTEDIELPVVVTEFNNVPVGGDATPIPFTTVSGRIEILAPAQIADLDEALNVEGGTLHFENDETYPWEIIEEDDRMYAKSTNIGIANSNAKITFTYTATAGEALSFDFICLGEGSDTNDWDGLRLYVDGTLAAKWGKDHTEWETYTYDLTAGEHTIEFRYKKDGSVNATGDYACVDNVGIIEGLVPPVTNVIDTIEINGFVEPAWGEAPFFAVTVPADAHYSVYEVVWVYQDIGDDGGPDMEEGQLFDSEEYEYWMHVKLHADEGYEFAAKEDMTVTVNGSSGIVGYHNNSDADSQEYFVNTISFTVTEPVPFDGIIWDFETDPWEQGFAAVDADEDGNNWEWVNPCTTSDYHHEGNGAMRSWSYLSGTGVLTPDNWLITPAFEGGTEIRFWLNPRSSSFNEDFVGVYVTVDGDEYVWGNELMSIMPEEDVTPVEYVLDLSDFAGQTIRVGFRHYDCEDQYAVLIDYITIPAPEEEPPVEPTVIDTIEINGFVEPAWGENPFYNVTVPADAHYSIDYTDWNWWDDTAEDGDIMNPTDTFNNEGYVYYQYFEIIPEEGYVFADDVTILVNGDASIIETKGWSSNNGYEWAYTVDFAVTEPTEPPASDLDEALNVEGGELHFETGETYPWIVVEDEDRMYAKSSNEGVASSTSVLTTIVNVEAGDCLVFEFMAWGEGTGGEVGVSVWDKCEFYVNDELVMKVGALQNDWQAFGYQFEEAGEYELRWQYAKDSSFNPTGDFFAVDNVEITDELPPEPIVIDTIEINDFVVPAWNEAPFYGVTVPEDAHYSVEDTVWVTWDGENSVEMVDGDLFNDPTLAYYMGILLVAEDGYKFDDPPYDEPTVTELMATINGSGEYVTYVAKLNDTTVAVYTIDFYVEAEEEVVSFYVDPYYQAAAPGETVSAAVMIEGEYEAHTLNLEFTYDASIFEITGVNQDAVLQQATANGGVVILDYETVPGSVRLGVIMPSEPFTAEGGLFTVEFNVKNNAAEGYYNLTPVISEFRNFPVDGEPTDIGYEAIDGVVEIVGEPVPGEVTFTVDSPDQVEQGEEFDVTVSVSGEYEAHGLNYALAYDSSVFEIVNVDTDSPILHAVNVLNGASVVDYETEDGVVRIGYILPEDGVSVEGGLIGITFRAKVDAAPGLYDFTQTVEEFRYFPLDAEEGEDIPFVTVDDSTEIVAGSEIGSATFTVTTGRFVQVEKGEEFNAQLTISGDYIAAHGLSMMVNYDADNFELVNIESGEILADCIVVVDYETIPGSIRLGAMQAEEGFSGDGVLLNMTFKAKEDAAVGIYDFVPEVTEFRYFPVDAEEGMDIPYETVSDQVEITEVPPTEVPPTEVPPTEVPPTEVPPTEVPPTEVPPTEVPPTEVPPTEEPPTEVPPTEVPPTTPPTPPTGTVALVGVGIAAIVAGAGVVLFRKKED